MAHKIAFSPVRVVATEKFRDRAGGTITLAAPRAVPSGEDEHGAPLFDVLEPEAEAPADAPHGRVVLAVETDDAFNAVAGGEWATVECTFLGQELPEPSAEERRAVVRPSKAAMAAAMGVALRDDATADDRARERVAPVRAAAPRVG